MEDKDKIIAELKAENVEIKTSYINFIAKLKREMITKDDIQDLKDTAKRFVEERNSLRKENAELKAENERLKEKIESYVCSQNCYAYKQAGKYRHILQEIKEIAERQLLVTNVRTYQMIYYADFSEYRNEILQKITKAEEE